MGFIAAIAVLVGVWWAVAEMRDRLPKAQGRQLRRWLLFWAARGVAAPFLIWLIFNLGVSERFPPLVTKIQAAAPGWATFWAFFTAVETGFFTIATYWAAVTLCWLWWEMREQVVDRMDFTQTAVGWSLLLGPLAALLIWGFGWGAAGVAGTLWLLPIVHSTIPLSFMPKRAPSYSRAITKMHGDKYKEAEAAVIEELEKSENDFNGWMMLAELYACHFGDLAGAERIVRDTCAHPNTNASEICVAFQRLADWHLQLANDPASARKALDEICRRYPDTHMGHAAANRLAQLPISKEDLIDARAPKRISLPALGRHLESPVEPQPAQGDREQFAARANECVRKLQLNPDNMVVREELARILADRLGKITSAIEQVELLMAMPDVPDQKAAEWMSMIAAWQLKHQNDEQAARETMDRLIRRFPQSAHADAARRRINLMDLEAKLRAARADAKPPVVKGVPTLSLST